MTTQFPSGFGRPTLWLFGCGTIWLQEPTLLMLTQRIKWRHRDLKRVQICSLCNSIYFFCFNPSFEVWLPWMFSPWGLCRNDWGQGKGVLANQKASSQLLWNVWGLPGDQRAPYFPSWTWLCPRCRQGHFGVLFGRGAHLVQRDPTLTLMENSHPS